MEWVALAFLRFFCFPCGSFAWEQEVMPGSKRKRNTAASTKAKPVSSTMEKFQTVLSSLVANFCDAPERFFTTNKKDAANLLQTTKTLYEVIKATEQQSGKSFSDLPELYTQGLELEQIWEELQLQNSPTLKYLNDMTERLDDYVPSEQEEEEEEEDDDEDMEERDGDFSSSSSGDSSGDDEKQEEDGGVKFTGMESSSDEGEEVEEEVEVEENKKKKQSSSVLTEEQRKRILARKIAQAAMMDDDDDDDDDDAVLGVSGEHADPDSFFNADDYEAFADGNEGIGDLMNVVVDEYDQLEELEESDEDSDDDDEKKSDKSDKREGDDDMEEYRVEKSDDNLDALSEPSYNDFFDPVNKSGKKSNGKNNSRKKKNDKEDEYIEDEGEDENYDSSEGEEDENEEDENEEDENEEDEEEEDEEDLSRHQRFQLEMKKKIKDHETENIQRRSWELMGEVGAGQRPRGSLMEAEMDYQRNTKVAPVITPEVTATLEDMIKERIKEELWDDVERKTADDFGTKKTKELKEISTEKSKIGLGEIYAQEFEQRFLGAAAVGEEEANKKEQAIYLLWKKLSSELDALTNFHYTPKPKLDEMKVRKNVSSIQMEEVIPMGVSSESAAAPEEIMRKRKGREGVLIGEEESTPEERQRARRAKKAARRKRRQAKLADEKAVARANPGLGNKYAMKKAMDGLTRARNVTQANDVDSGVKWTKSSDVFKKLQEEVTSGIASGKGEGGKKNKRQKTGGRGNGYKL